ncbi:MAG: 30S ribosomal protein S16 [bacterium]
MLKIRLTRVGKKNSPAYRVVVADQKRAVKGKFQEIIGNYNPTLKPKTVVIDKERALYWISKGAQVSDTVNNLMCDLRILDKKARIKKTIAQKAVEAAAAEVATEPVATEEVVVEEAVEPVATEEVAAESEVIEPVVEEIAEPATPSDTTEEK